jgi:Asp-tRNA(Asn)/Glu-tRNA(Gln) amidotransferase A subunit family amidase
LPELSRSLRAGLLDLDDLLDDLEKRFDAREGEIQAFVPEPNRFERLRQDAKQLKLRFSEDSRPDLFGIPIGFKDIIHVDGFTTRAGSRLPVEDLKGDEGPLVKSLRDAGCLVVGKTVSTEFAYFAPGPTRNPLQLDHTPGGSSSGSAAAVSAGLCSLALGTQTIGSISRPASFCGVVGYKPSYDRTSREGVIPLSPSLDHVGFFTSDVDSLEQVARLICAEWRSSTVPSKARLGVPTGPYLERASLRARNELEAKCQKLSETGFTVKEVPAFLDFEAIETKHHLLVAREAAAVHAKWYNDYPDLYHEKTRELIERGRAVPNDAAESAVNGRIQLRNELSDLMDSAGIDVWLSPAALDGAPEGLDSTGDPVMNLPWTYAGFPTVTLAGSRQDGAMPIGLQVAGSWFDDESLLGWASDIEKVISG